MTTSTKRVNILDLVPGNIVHHHGARFKISQTIVREDKDVVILGFGLDKLMCANGVWIDGATETGYFGPGIDWNFQGNANKFVHIEA